MSNNISSLDSIKAYHQQQFHKSQSPLESRADKSDSVARSCLDAERVSHPYSPRRPVHRFSPSPSYPYSPSPTEFSPSPPSPYSPSPVHRFSPPLLAPYSPLPVHRFSPPPPSLYSPLPVHRPVPRPRFSPSTSYTYSPIRRPRSSPLPLSISSQSQQAVIPDKIKKLKVRYSPEMHLNMTGKRNLDHQIETGHLEDAITDMIHDMNGSDTCPLASTPFEKKRKFVKTFDVIEDGSTTKSLRVVMGGKRQSPCIITAYYMPKNSPLIERAQPDQNLPSVGS